MQRSLISLSYLPVLLLWGVVAIPFALHAPDGAYTHDFPDQLGYTQFLHQNHRLPFPGEIGEGHQAPLYYLIVSPLAFSTPYHVKAVRFFSVLLGALALGLLHITLVSFGIKTGSRLLALCFCATTPHFLFLFSSYNNDALAVFLGLLLWTLFLQCSKNPSKGKAWSLGLVMMAGLFTKLSFCAAWAAVAAAAFYFRRRGVGTSHAWKPFLIALGLAIVPPLAWLYFQNTHANGHNPVVNHLTLPFQQLPHSPLETILTPPGFTTWEWVTPYADAFLPIGKKNSLIAYAWVTSIFGEYSFHQIKDVCAWFILWVHTLWLIAALWQIPRTPVSRALGIAFLVGGLALAGFVTLSSFGSAMDFRYIAWLWLPLTVLRAQALESPPSWMKPFQRRLALGIILLGILTQWTLISSL